MCSSMMKCLLIVFNAIFFLVGAALFAGAAYINWANEDIKSYLEVISVGEDINNEIENIDTSDNVIQIAIYVALGVGIVIAFISFMGLCGAVRKKACMLNVYCACCFVLLAAEIAVAVLAVLFKNEIESTIEDELTKQAEGYIGYDNGTKVDSSLSQAWDVLQRELKCCGGSGPEDYGRNDNFPEMTPVPESCCVDNITLCYAQARELLYTNDTGMPSDETMDYVYTQGCHEALVDWFNDKLLFFIIGGSVLAIIQIAGIIFACCVKKEISKEIV